MNGPNSRAFRQSVEAYVRSIVTNDLPLPVEKFSCSVCGAPYSKLVELPIPPHSRQNRRRGLYSARARGDVLEPALAQCGTCTTKFSSQHILRQVLIDNRPLHWPPWQRTLTSSEIDDVARHESASRSTVSDAIDLVSEREKSQLLLRDECLRLRDEYGISSTLEEDFLQRLNSARMATCKSDDDPFLNDELTRLIEMLPPMPSDSRLTREGIDYMVSALVTLLNQHWWCHTSSCFKVSKTTVNDSFCRYQFPRDRHPLTSFDLSGVKLKRSLAHEFINGYNYEIMAAFKCNHDIQFLMGGRDATDRIHYCTKYVTKQQKRLESVVVVALAAFRRRQEKEKAAITASEPGCFDSLAKARKRVASMVYTMTNRQEVAGPLAALYLYRGSCCYESAGCSYVPLSDIIRQLCSKEEYACRIVNESDESGSSRYLSVSFRDDYTYRPSQLSNLCVYEFAMRYFRKKDHQFFTPNRPFKIAHPLHLTHSLGKRHEQVVPVIQGFRIPYVADKSSDETRCKRAILSLVLFKPFQSLVDLIGSSNPSTNGWIDSYAEWQHTRSEFVKSIMDHIDDYYCGADRAKAHADQMATNVSVAEAGSDLDGDSESDRNNKSDDELFGEEDFDGDDEVSATESFVNPWLVIDGNDDAPLDAQSLHPAQCPSSAAPDTRVASILDVFKTNQMLEGSALITASTQQNTQLNVDFPSVATMRKWVQDDDTDTKLREASFATNDRHDAEVIELLNNALLEDDMTWSDASIPSLPTVTPKASFASVSSISADYTLNRKQHCAFKLIAKALLSRWRKVEDLTYSKNDSDDALRHDQLRLFLGGEGGTGKSRVLDAVQALCESWNRSDCLVKTALTGKAATMINGRTLASFLLQLRYRRNLSSAIYIDVLVIDEVSMMRKAQLAQLDKLLRIAKRVPGVLFGGVHIVLVGDFLQLPPVGGEPLYKDPSWSRRQTPTSWPGLRCGGGLIT
jgi:hypothetical protein